MVEWNHREGGGVDARLHSDKGQGREGKSAVRYKTTLSRHIRLYACPNTLPTDGVMSKENKHF